MNRFFDQDSGIMKALSKIFDISYLSIIWLIFSLPIITMGASFTALYYATVKVIRRERGYVFAEFWHSFKQNFMNATILWMGIITLAFLLYNNIQIIGQTKNDKSGYLMGVYLALGIIILLISCYIFPVLSRFELKKTKIVRFAFYLSMRYILITILLLIILVVGAAGFAISIIYPPAIIFLFVLPVLCTWLYSHLMEYVLKKHMPKPSLKVTEDGEEITEWYME